MKLPFEYKLTRKNVKNINCRIKSDGIVYVSAPKSVSIEYIESFLLSKEDIILKSIEKASKKRENIIADNEKIFILGKEYTIKAIECLEQKIYLKENLFIIETKSFDTEHLENMVDYFALHYCKNICKPLIEKSFFLLKDYNISMPTIKYRKMKSMWGNCRKYKNTITLSTNLIFTNYDFVEYVVLHEFVHLIHPHHQKEFYDIIKRFMPNYKEIKGNLYD